MTRRTRIPSQAALVAIMALIAGCSANPDTATTFDPTDSALIAGAYANPLDPVMFPDPTHQSIIASSLDTIVGTCMAKAGFTYQAGEVFPKRRSAQDAQYTYSVTDPDVAAQYGFHPASWVEEQQTKTPPSDARQQEYDQALFGQVDKTQITDDDGTVIATYDPASCAGKAKDSITPGWAEQDRILNLSADILLAVSDQVAKDPDVQSADVKWSECMAKRGYEYDTPTDANNDEQFATDLPTAQEIPVAVASATCQQDTGLLRTWSRVRAQHTQVELDKHPGILTQWLQLQSEAAKRASGA